MRGSAPQSSEPLATRWMAFSVLLMANFLNVMDGTIVNVALPTLKAEFGATPSQSEWVVASYIFVFALFLLPCGRLGDTFGRRRMFILGVAVFTATSALCGAATSMETLIAGRVLQGLGSAMMAPQTMALVPNLFPPQERGAAFGLFAVAAGLASVAGPIVGGLLIAADIAGLGWRPIFLVKIPLGILAIFLALRLVPFVPGRRSLGIDGVGITLAGVAMLALLVPMVEIPTIGWRHWMAPLLIGAPVLVALFVVWERRQARLSRPELVPADLLRTRSFLMGCLLTGLHFSGVPGFFLVMAIFFQQGFGLSALQSGMMVVPFSLGILAAAPLARRLGSDHLRYRVIGGALLLAASGLALRVVASSITNTVPWLWFGPFFLASGFGTATAAPALFQIALSGAGLSDSGSASGALRSIQQIGAAFGVAIMGGVFFWVLGDAPAGDHVAYVAAAKAAFTYTALAYATLAALAFVTHLGPSEVDDLASP